MDAQENPPTSATLGDRMMNVFVSPGEAFTGLAEAPSKTALWLIPFLIFIILGIGVTYLFYANETLRDQIVETQRMAMGEAVKDGKMTQAQADRAIEGMENVGLGLFMVFGSVPMMFFVAGYFFCGTLFLWLTSKVVLKSSVGYVKHLELYGIASWIGILGFVVSVLMMVGMESMYASPSAALAVLSDYNPIDRTHKLLSALNVFSIWQTAAIGIGLSMFSGKPTGTGIAVAFVLWVIWLAVAIPLGLVR
jgi:hypothetical protein